MKRNSPSTTSFGSKVDYLLPLRLSEMSLLVTTIPWLLFTSPTGSDHQNLKFPEGTKGDPWSPYMRMGDLTKKDFGMSSNDMAQRLSQAHFEFTLKLYSALVSTGDSSANMAFSPLLVSTLLTPTLLSAREYAIILSARLKRAISPNPASATEGDHVSIELRSGQSSTSLDEGIGLRMAMVADQIQKVLRFPDLSLAGIDAWHKATVASLQDKYYKRFLKAPRGLLILQKQGLNKDLDRTLRKWFGHTFRKFHEPLSSPFVLHQLNRWAENQSGAKLSDFLEDGSLDNKKSAIVSPAVIHSLWLNDFDPNNTFHKGLFYRTPDDRFEIPIMIQRKEVPLGYSAALEARVLELPFHVRRASLFLLLPDHLESGLESLERNLTSENVRVLLSTLKVQIVNLRLPRFYIDTRLSLVKGLKLLGVKDLFRDEGQNERPISEDTNILQLDDFIHRIRFEIREKGNEEKPSTSSSLERFAEVDTGSRTDETLSKFSEKYFEADHPFIFFLWDYIASTIICMGRVMDPREITRISPSYPGVLTTPGHP